MYKTTIPLVTAATVLPQTGEANYSYVAYGICIMLSGYVLFRLMRLLDKQRS